MPVANIVAVVTVAVGALVSIVIVRALELLESVPLSVCLATIDHVPDVKAGDKAHPVSVTEEI